VPDKFFISCSNLCCVLPNQSVIIYGYFVQPAMAENFIVDFFLLVKEQRHLECDKSVRLLKDVKCKFSYFT